MRIFLRGKTIYTSQISPLNCPGAFRLREPCVMQWLLCSVAKSGLKVFILKKLPVLNPALHSMYSMYVCDMQSLTYTWLARLGLFFFFARLRVFFIAMSCQLPQKNSGVLK